MKTKKDTNKSVTKAFRLLSLIVADGGRDSLTEIAASQAIPLPTAHRLAETLVQQGYLVRSRRGHYHAGPELRRLGANLSIADVASGIARPLLAKLARKYECTAHLGVLESGMVTYLVKEGCAKTELFTREEMQLEAYCSAIGKILLAAEPEQELEAYLDNGPFVSLTANTLVSPDILRAEIVSVRGNGYALDKREVSEDLFCIAVPLINCDGETFAAISLSFHQVEITPQKIDRYVPVLNDTASIIAQKLAGHL